MDKLNILPGSSGSPLIEYQADQKKFMMNGIYWGTTSFSGIDLKNLDYSYGMITKLIATGKYDLISNTDFNTPHDNNLCSYLTTHNPTFKSDFC